LDYPIQAKLVNEHRAVNANRVFSHARCSVIARITIEQATFLRTAMIVLLPIVASAQSKPGGTGSQRWAGANTSSPKLYSPI
jgi:hypothetical protein